MPLLALLAALLPASSAHAYRYGPYGCNLRWDHCYGDGGVQNKTFACDTNSGSETLVASFVPAWDIVNVVGIEIEMDLASASATLPAWWSTFSAGTCRPTALAASPAPVDPLVTNCPDWGQGVQSGGIAAYQVGIYGANFARIKLGWAVPQDVVLSLAGRQEDFAYRLTISHVHTVGSGACADCTTPVCILLASVNMVTPIQANTRWLTGPANQVDSDFATWQGGGVPATRLGTGCPAATPTRQRTWGEVKSLYR